MKNLEVFSISLSEKQPVPDFEGALNALSLLPNLREFSENFPLDQYFMPALYRFATSASGLQKVTISLKNERQFEKIAKAFRLGVRIEMVKGLQRTVIIA